jgi:hypothetical protein
VIDFLDKQIPKGVWKHAAQEGNGDAHLKAGPVGPSETIPPIAGRPDLSRRQNIFFWEFYGPRPRSSAGLFPITSPPNHSPGRRIRIAVKERTPEGAYPLILRWTRLPAAMVPNPSPR